MGLLAGTPHSYDLSAVSARPNRPSTLAAPAYRVKEEDLDEVLGEAIHTFQQTRSKPVNPGRFQWLYRANPDGEAVVWSIREAGSGRMAGYRVCIPRRVLVDGRVRRAWNGGDFSIHREYRTLGVALKLDRVTRKAVDEGRVDLFYSFPTERMQLVHERVGFPKVEAVVRLVKPLRTAYYFRRRRATRWMAPLVSPVADAIMSRRSPERHHRFTLAVRAVSEARFDDRFDRLFEDAARIRRVIGVRDARYLTWRYAQNPLHRSHALLAEDGGRLLGYGLFRRGAEVAHVQDVLAVDEVALRDVVVGLVRQSRELGLSGIEADVAEGNPVRPILNELGFLRRLDSSAVSAYAPERSALRSTVVAGRNWFLTLGDRDV